LSRRTNFHVACFFNRLQAAACTRVINSDTTRRALFTLVLVLLLAPSLAAQSVLNFGRAVVDGRQNTGIAIANPNPYFANVQLTFYGFDGNPIANDMVNPVNYSIAPKSELQMLVSDLFLGGSVQGWVQATSPSSGLVGYYFTGNFSTMLDGSGSVTPLTTQVIPLIREDQNTHTDLMIINPGPDKGTITVDLFNIRGDWIGSKSESLASHAVLSFRPGAEYPIIGSAGTSARISSTVPVSTMAIVNATDSLMFVNGQSVEQNSRVRIVPHFVSGNGTKSQLILTNPNGFAVDATVTLFGQDGGAVHPSRTGPSSKDVTIPPHGLVSFDAASLTDLPLSPSVNGWIRIDSGNLPLDGLVVLDNGGALSAIPMQVSSSDRMLFSQLTDSSDAFTEFDFVNTETAPATLDVSLLRTDGTLLAQKNITIGAGRKLSSQVRDLIPEAAGRNDGFMYVRSSPGVYGVEMLGGKNLRFLATVAPERMNSDYVPAVVPVLPKISSVDPGVEILAGTTLRLTVSGATGDTQVLLGNLTIAPRFPAPSLTLMLVDVPNIEPGYAKLRIRVRGVESDAITIHILPFEDESLTPIKGQAFFQKIDVTDNGLDLAHPSMSPIRNARVEVLDAVTQALISVSETGDRGQFIADVPDAFPVTIRVVSRLSSMALRVIDNTNNNALYSISIPFDSRENADARIIDRTRTSGAFNILEMIQRGNAMLHLADLSAVPPAPTIFWSLRNTRVAGDVRQGQVSTTYFSLASNTAYILGDRNTDSDEYDDSVVLHEYAHMLAARFSRDDSPGGWHAIGQSLDPRLAWSEGFANFFSGAVRNDAVYRDSSGPNGINILRIDLEDNQPPGDRPGYDSEASVQSLLWDMFDSSNDAGDAVQYSFASIWASITDLRNDRFVYLPYFLERFLARYPAETEVLRTMVQLRSIDFQPNVRPSVTNPFPRPITVGTPVSGSIDSYTPKKDHLAQSAHFFTFTTTASQMVAIRMDIIGLGPGSNPAFNDLDIFLTDINGNLVDSSDRGLNGQSELVTRRLPAGTYVVEIRSYYTKAETNGRVYNSGDYRLNITAQ
jgi:hypothetical protein